METFKLELCKHFITYQNVDNINGIRDIILVLILLMKQLSHQVNRHL